jgi:iron complex outermembrane receptor protein
MGTTVPRFRCSYVLLALGLLPWTLAGAADVPNDTTSDADNSGTEKNSSLQEVVVTGSLIPQHDVSIQTPVTVISSEDIEAKGFSDVAEALQRSAFATGAVQNGQFSFGFTQGAKVASLFGLDVSFTKYLIDGRPIAQYPELYNGTGNFVSISGIPTALIDHIDTLPGAQSSIYGSDAIAGVINIVMKKNLDGPYVDARYGWTADGGGTDRRIAIADGASFGNLSVEIGGQYEKLDPIYGFQRPLTNHYYTQGTTPQAGQQDFLVFGEQNFYLLDPANCANVSPLFGGTVHVQTVKAGGYCGTDSAGFQTLTNGDESTQGYLRATYDVTDNLQVFVESLANHDVVKFNNGLLNYNTEFDSTAPYFFYEDPNIPGDFLNVNHDFSPEEAGGISKGFNKNTNNSIRATLGASGSFLSSFTYLADFTYTQNKLTESTFLQFTQPIEAFYANIFGPGVFDAPNDSYIFSPNYGQFYKPLTPAQYDAFSGSINTYSYTEESFARAQVTDTDLFALPGGNAALALQFDGGDQGWNVSPNPDYFDNAAFGFTATAGGGHRSRYAGTLELELPIFKMLSANASGRYDDYRVSGSNVDKFTYNLGLQFKPVEQFLLRGRYGTAFRAPTLADEFQGQSGAFTGLTDYYLCAKEGFTGPTIGNCPQFNQSTFLLTQGNTKLAPVNAKVWDLGFIVTPINRLQLTADFIHFAITDEIVEADPNKILQTEAACLLGQLDANSTTCTTAVAEVSRNAQGEILSVLDPKQNESEENLGTLVMELDYKFALGLVGEFDLSGSYTNVVSHNLQQFPGDPIINLLNNPFFSTEFKTKDNLTLSWSKNQFGATVYVERYGETPNYVSQLQPSGYATPGAGTVNAWTLANASINYRPTSNSEITFSVNNLFNTGPPSDHSYPGNFSVPYDIFDYNDFGRSYFINVSWHGGTR